VQQTILSRACGTGLIIIVNLPLVSFLAFTAAVLTNLAPVRFFAVGAWELTDAIAKGFALRAGNKR